jgi:hypothetical protein
MLSTQSLSAPGEHRVSMGLALTFDPFPDEIIPLKSQTGSEVDEQILFGHMPSPEKKVPASSPTE